jgi:hypothetical protein
VWMKVVARKGQRESLMSNATMPIIFSLRTASVIALRWSAWTASLRMQIEVPSKTVAVRQPQLAFRCLYRRVKLRQDAFAWFAAGTKLRRSAHSAGPRPRSHLVLRRRRCSRDRRSYKGMVERIPHAKSAILLVLSIGPTYGGRRNPLVQQKPTSKLTLSRVRWAKWTPRRCP